MDRIEFEEKLSEAIPFLKVSAKRFTADADDCNDLVQEALLKALRFCEQFKKGTNLKGWLYTIVRNTYIDSYHFKAMRRAETIQVDDLSPAQLFRSSTNNNAESKFQIDEIKSAINYLKKDLSIPFSMYKDGYRYHEIAAWLSVPMGTVKTRIHMARKLLQKNLQHYRVGSMA